MGNPGPEERPTVPADGPQSSSGTPDANANPSGCVTPDEIPRPPSDSGVHGLPLPRFPNHFRGPRRYEILSEHGRGGLGKVSRAFDRKLGRDVAIKELHSRGTGNEVRFLREVLITARLEHPGIVPIHEAGRWPDGTPYYAMKLVSGRSLRELIAERHTFEQRIGLLHHVIAVADAIAYAHGRNIIHRDLKPANVIVGDFGETIVSDWGLAKDLTTPDLAPDDHDDFAESHESHVTAQGSVVGTPAYMAPEQKRGESVDQRADVFAIGTMLWELCAVAKVPPKAHLRTRMLRRAGVDADFAAIINKALDPDRERRYPDAGALAADLKAFRSGVRITARDYSFFALLAHWTRRHRTLALSAAAILVLAVAGTLLYVRNIAVERDRADRSLDELTLKHAELLLATDPSAALDALSSYRGTDHIRADQIRAEAVGRGVAVLRTVPHTEDIQWTGFGPDGSILSLSSDGTIARTYLDGSSSVLTRGVAKIAMVAYSPARYLLAYTCDPSDLCLFDIAHAVRTPLASTLQGAGANGASFSPDGTLLAVVSLDNTLRIIDVKDPSRPTIKLVTRTAGNTDLTFIDDNVLAIALQDGIELVRVTGESEVFAVPGFVRWASSASEHQIALALKSGPAVILQSFPARIIAKAELCSGMIAHLQFIPRKAGFAYACKDGSVGVWDPQRASVQRRAQIEGHANFVEVSPNGEYIIAGGGNGVVTVIDLSTDLIASYRGHGVPLTSLAAPTLDHPFVLSADTRGALRVWAAPPRFARVVATSSTPFKSAFFHKDSRTIIAASWAHALTVFSPATGVQNLEPHESLNFSLRHSTSGHTFAAFGPQDVVEVWSSDSMTRTRVIATAHGSVTQLQFIDGSEDFMTSGNDGRLVRWTVGGTQTLVTQSKQPIDNFTTASPSGPILYSTTDGALWRIDASEVHLLRIGDSRISRIVAAPRHEKVYVGYTNGDVLAFDTRSWVANIIFRGASAIHEIVLTENEDTIAILTSVGMVYLGRYQNGSNADPAEWEQLVTQSRNIALTSDHLLIAACPDGIVWIYAVNQQHWLCLPLQTAYLGELAVTSNGNTAVALDREGRLISIDLEAARNLLDVATPSSESTKGA
ncbi:MAG TPA: serine/threonine-protein kinase [Kofleriaceae bacterium]|nr:serine/threonine-protein kinase [Kofleriaceae bacterium]